jgi:hypothetical protein
MILVDFFDSEDNVTFVKMSDTFGGLGVVFNFVCIDVVLVRTENIQRNKRLNLEHLVNTKVRSYNLCKESIKIFDITSILLFLIICIRKRTKKLFY